MSLLRSQSCGKNYLIFVKTKSFNVKLNGMHSLAGYAFRRQKVDTSRHELPACITIMKNTDDSEVCIINLPFVALDQTIYSLIKKSVFQSTKIQNVILSVSHTHSSPSISEAYAHLWQSDSDLCELVIQQINTAILNLHLYNDFKLLTSVTVHRSKKIPSTYRRVKTIFGLKMLPNHQRELSSFIYKVLFYSSDQAIAQFVIGDMHPTSNVNMEIISNDYFDMLEEPSSHFMPGVIGDIRPDITKKSLKVFIATLGKHKRVFTRSNKSYQKFKREFRKALTFECVSFIKLNERSQYRLENTNFGYSDIFETKSKLNISVTTLSLTKLDLVFVTSEISRLVVANSPRRLFISCCAPYSGYLPHISQLKNGGYEVNENREILLNDNLPLSANRNKWNRFVSYLQGGPQ